MKTILDYIISNRKTAHISFAAPGHKNRSAIFDRAGYGEFYRDMLASDICANTADNMADAENLIRSTMDYYADLYGVSHTELLLNETACGVTAAISTCVPRGGKMILGRDVDRSVFDAMRNGAVQPVYMRSIYNAKFGLNEGISPTEVRMACEDNPEARAVLVTSPNRYGMISDIAAIADIAHQHGMILIVDQTYGAHLRFFDAVNNTASAAEQLGADITINGTDRTLLSLGDTGIMNVCSDRVDIDALQDELRVLQNNRFSYLAMGSLDINEKILRRYGGDMVNTWMNDLRYVYKQLTAISGVKVVTSDSLDPTAISFSLADIGVNGARLAQELESRSIRVEKVHGDYVLLSTAAGNIRADYEALIAAVKSIVDNYGMGSHTLLPQADMPDFVLGCSTVPRNKVSVPLYRSDGRVLYNPIVFYPPGTAVACPGEIMNMEIISSIAKALERGDVVEGVDEEGYIFIGK